MHALLLPGGRFSCPRMSRSLVAKYPPFVRPSGVSAVSPRPHPSRDQSASAALSRPQPVRDHVHSSSSDTATNRQCRGFPAGSTRLKHGSATELLRLRIVPDPGQITSTFASGTRIAHSADRQRTFHLQSSVAFTVVSSFSRLPPVRFRCMSTLDPAAVREKTAS